MRHQVTYKIVIAGTLSVDADNEVKASEAARLALRHLVRYNELPDDPSVEMGPSQDEVEIESAVPEDEL